MCRFVSKVFVLVFLLSAAIASAETSPHLNCVSVSVDPLDRNNPDYAKNVNLTFHNGCGKDITAVGFHLHPNDGGDWSVGWDYTIRMGQAEDLKRHNEIFRADATTHQEVARTNPRQNKIRASAAYIVFLDCTSVGDAEQIKQVVRSRRDEVSIYEQQEQMLAELTDHDRAATYLAESHDDLRGVNRIFLKGLRKRIQQMTPGDWTAFIQERQENAKRLVSTFETHSVVTLPTS